jgi:hypothetical protein
MPKKRDGRSALRPGFKSTGGAPTGGVGAHAAQDLAPVTPGPASIGSAGTPSRAAGFCCRPFALSPHETAWRCAVAPRHLRRGGRRRNFQRSYAAHRALGARDGIAWRCIPAPGAFRRARAPGQYRIHGRHTAESNAAFDADRASAMRAGECATWKRCASSPNAPASCSRNGCPCLPRLAGATRRRRPSVDGLRRPGTPRGRAHGTVGGGARGV